MAKVGVKNGQDGTPQNTIKAYIKRETVAAPVSHGSTPPWKK
jgi:hypothetical protein